MTRLDVLAGVSAVLIGVGIAITGYQRCPDPQPVKQEKSVDSEWQPTLPLSSRYITRLKGSYREPDESYLGRLKYTKIYWCAGKDCDDWKPEISKYYPYQPVEHMSDDGYGNNVITVDFEIDTPLEEIIRVKVVSVDKDGIESVGRIVQVR